MIASEPGAISSELNARVSRFDARTSELDAVASLSQIDAGPSEIGAEASEGNAMASEPGGAIPRSVSIGVSQRKSEASVLKYDDLVRDRRRHRSRLKVDEER